MPRLEVFIMFTCVFAAGAVIAFHWAESSRGRGQVQCVRRDRAAIPSKRASFAFAVRCDQKKGFPSPRPKDGYRTASV